jgi:serine protease
MNKSKLFAILLLQILCVGFGQMLQAQTSKNNKHYKLAATVKPTDYEQGKILVKLKPDIQQLITQPSLVAAKWQTALEKNGSTTFGSLFTAQDAAQQKLEQNLQNQQGGRANNTQKSGVDLSLFYQAAYNPNKVDIETAISNLYATGLVQYAEPAFIRQNFYKPNDNLLPEQTWLSRVKAEEAWDTSKGDSSVVIAIVDSGVQLNHPDLKNKIKYNLKETINGIDDDNDGFIDNTRGWDYAGADFNALKSDNNPTIFGDNNTHGSAVAGCAAADTDNKIGGAGLGFNCKILPIKHAADNDTRGQGGSNQGLYGTFLGILYAANHGASIINCSYGSDDYSQTEQDVVNYATIDKGCLVVAAAGNSGKREASYPASYNYVLSIGATEPTDKKASFSTYHFTVDLSAPGTQIYTTHYDATYDNTDGTSFSSPITAGAAGLLKAMYPNFSGLQIGELLRTTADDNIVVTGSIKKEEMGNGRLNIQRATKEKPFAIKLINYEVLNDRGSNAQAGDTATLSGDFLNYLFATTPKLKVTLSSANSAIQVLNGEVNLGLMQMMQRTNNRSTPFRIALQKNVPKDTEVILRLDYEDEGKVDRQFIAVTLNPSYYIINKNSMTTSIGSIGRIGYEDIGKQTGGVGFVYNGTPILYELGLMVGISNTQVPNTVRSTGNGIFANDFQPVNFVSEVLPSKVSSYDLQGIINDNSASTRKIGVTINYKSFVWAGVPNDKYFIVEYTIRNTRGTNIDNLAIGLFADWDLSENGGEDKADWDNDNRLGYIYHTASTGIYGGIQLLNNNLAPNYYAIDNDDNVGVGVYSSNTDKGFTDTEKYKTLSNGLAKIKAGDKETKGQDVSHVVAAGGIKIAANDSVKVAFAFLAGDNLQDLKNSAKAANIMYNQTLKASQPLTTNAVVCYDSKATLTATGASKLNWYNSITGGKLIATGTSYTTTALKTDSTFYVSNAEQPFESVRTPASVRLATIPEVLVNGNLSICKGEKVRLTATRGQTFIWLNGATSRSIEVSAAGTYSVRIASQNPTCVSNSQPIVITEKTAPEANFSSSISTVDLANNMAITFTDRSTNAAKWAWDFGEGSTSTEKNPVITFKKFGDFVVQLTVTSAEGCTSTLSKPFVVTGNENHVFASQINLFPNPNNGDFALKIDNQALGLVQIKIYNQLGILVWEQNNPKANANAEINLQLPHLPAGLYSVHLQNGKSWAVKKMQLLRE